MPNISGFLDQLEKCQYFNTLDHFSGFRQIEVSEKDISRHVRMPLRIKNAPSTFQKVMNNILLGIQNERYCVYRDGLIILSSTTHDQIFQLIEVFKRLPSANLKIQPDSER